MATTNADRVGRALELLRDGLRPFVERELKSRHGDRWTSEVKMALSDKRLGTRKGDTLQDVAVLLVVMDKTWGQVFGAILGRAERSLVNELVDIRNRWAHQEPFSTDDTYRALDSVGRLLTAVSAPESADFEKMKMELLRVKFDEQARSEKRKAAATPLEAQVSGNLKPWREVVTPHKDVASGRYQQAEFAADLWQVHLGEGSDEYRNPKEFYRRTYLTDSLKRLLIGAVRRVHGAGGDPVVQLQTNFGGGKTHSMLALYHLFSGTKPGDLLGVLEILKEAGLPKLPYVKRVVLVGNRISPGNPVTKKDGTVVRTLWGELAYQLDGKKAFKRIQADDEKATNPGDVLRELLKEHGPCLILIDEWVAYARQLHEQSDLPAGTFETQFSFAQTLTECVKGAANSLLVISLPASDTTASPHTQAEDIEVGGQRGREALGRLQNVVGRLESSWRPATAEEGFEIVRRRLFEPMVDPKQFVDRDTVAKAFVELYRTQQQEFPQEARQADYEQRIKAAYPIHPEIFDRLYTDWSTLVKFQRTRGVLRLMAATIHSLWEKGDRGPLILPSHLPLDEGRVRSEVMHYLSDAWDGVIERDIDGPNSLPLGLDRELPNLGKYSACRRVARTVFLGSAPSLGMAHRGLEDKRIKLGCVMPGESAAIFGDALRRLSTSGTFLYQDSTRYWYDTRATVTKRAQDIAAQLKDEPDTVAAEIERRVKAEIARKGDFARVHALPHSGQDVPDDLDARLVVLSVAQPYSREPASPAEVAAKAILESRGNAPRLFRNSLAFLAIDRTRLQDLDEAVRQFIAWDRILLERDALDLSANQVRQAESQRKSANDSVDARLPEAYQWLLVPVQATPNDPVTWQALRVTGQESLAARASKKLRNEELLIVGLAGTRLRMELDKIPLWRGNHVEIRQLAEDFARYPYLPRLRDTGVLLGAVQDGLGLLMWTHDSFAYADSIDEETGRYRGLRGGERVSFPGDEPRGLLVRPDVAAKQLAEAGSDVGAPGPGAPGAPGAATVEEHEETEVASAAPPAPTRFHGSVTLDSARVGRDAGRIADEVISHLAGLVRAKVKVTLEIDAKVPGGVPDKVVRIVTENSRTLKFESQGFEEE